MPYKVLIELALLVDAAPSKIAEQDIRNAVRSLGEDLAYLATVTRCELVAAERAKEEP